MVVLAFILLILSGVSKAVMDKTNFHYHVSIFNSWNPLFWNPELSWRNKYKKGLKGEGPKFFGSTTFLVWTTDAWHLFSFIYGILFATGFLLIGRYATLWMFIPAYITVRVVFELVFKYVFSKRN